MSENLREIMTWILGSQGLILVALLFSRKNNKQANLFLGSYLVLLLALIFIKTFLKPTPGQFETSPQLLLAPYSIWFLAAPLPYFYVRTLLGRPFELRGQTMLHVIPFVLVLPGLLLYPLPASLPDSLEWTNNLPVSKEFSLFFSLAIIIAQLIYVILALRLVYTHSPEVKSDYSAAEATHLRWLRTLMLLIISTFVLSIAAEIMVYAELRSWRFFYNISFYGIMIMFYLISYKAVTQPQLFKQINPYDTVTSAVTDHPEFVKYEKNKLSQAQANTYCQRLVSLVEDQKVFLNPNLTLQDLADQLDITKHHLSQVLSSMLHQNFYQFVNGYRVRHVQNHLQNQDKSNLSLLGLAMESGFNSKSAFNRAFKNHTGMTPSAYVKQLSTIV